MKILLISINSQYVHTNLAVQYIKANFTADAELTLLDFSLKDHFGYIVQQIVSQNPDFVAFSTYVWNVELILAIVLDLKNIMPGCLMLLGGPEADYNCQKLLGYPGVDFVFRGEGDGAFSEFIDRLQRRDVLPPFVATKKNPLAEQTLTGNLELLHPPYNEQNILNYANRLIYYETSRGCPNACTYCLSSAIRGMRFFNLELVERDFRLFVGARIKTVKIIDRTFNVPETRSMQILKLIRALHEELAGTTIFHIELVADQLSDNFIEYLRSMPKDLIQVEIGVQSLNIQTLKEINRNMDSKKLLDNVTKILELKNIHVHLDLIAGLPYETLDSFVHAINFVLNLEPHQFQLGFLKKISGTQLPETTEHEMVFSAKPPYELYRNKYMSFSEISYLKKIEKMIDLYYNSGRFLHTWKYLVETCYLDHYGFCTDLLGYFEKNILPESSFAPRKLFSYLHDFIIERDFPDKDFLINVLSFDYLLQEKPKFFPEWIPYKKDKDLLELARKQNLAIEEKTNSLLKIEDKIHTSYLNLQITRQNAKYHLFRSQKPEALVFYYPEDKNRLDMNEARHLEISA